MKNCGTEMAKQTTFETHEIKKLTNGIRVNNSDTKIDIGETKIYTSEGGKDTRDCNSGEILKQQQQQQQQDLEPPDGGWGWMVAFGVFLVTMTIPITASSSGILYSSQLLEWQASSTTISIIFSGYLVMWKVAGVFVTTLTKEFGFRPLAMAGALLRTICVIITSAVTSPALLFLFYSIGCGLGAGMSTVDFLLLAQYFKKRRGRANVFLQAGVGVGRMTSPLMIQFLQTEYGYQGSTMIMGAFTLHAFVGACLYQPVEWHMRRPDPCRKLSNSETHTNEPHPQKLPLLSHNTHNLGEKTDSGYSNKKNDSIITNKKRDSKNLDKTGDSTDNIRKKSDSVNFYSPNSHDKNGSLPGATVEVSRRTSRGRTESQCSYTSKALNRLSLSPSDQNLASLPSVVSLASVINYELAGKDHENSDSVLPERKDQNAVCRILHRTAKISRAIIKDIAILRHPPALAMSFGTALTMSSQVYFLTMLPFAVQAAGHSLEVAAWCLFVSGITNFLMRIAASGLSDFSWFNTKFALLGGMFVMAAAITVTPFQTSSTGLVVVMTVFGSALGIFHGLCYLHMAKNVDHHYLTPMVGSGNLTSAISFVTIGPLTGVIRDLSDSYAVCLWVLAGIIIISMLLWSLLPLLKAHFPLPPPPDDTNPTST